MKKQNAPSKPACKLSKSASAPSRPAKTKVPSAPSPSWSQQPGLKVDDATLAELLEQLGLLSCVTEIDYLIIGDGSGSTWDREIGWASYCIEMASKTLEADWGFAHRGSVNVAEILALQFPLMRLAAREADRRQQPDERLRTYQIHLVSDSQYVCNTGASGNRLYKKNAALWAHFDTFARQGLALHWHWLRRCTHSYHILVDKLSKLARITGRNTIR